MEQFSLRPLHYRNDFNGSWSFLRGSLILCFTCFRRPQFFSAKPMWVSISVKYWPWKAGHFGLTTFVRIAWKHSAFERDKEQYSRVECGSGSAQVTVDGAVAVSADDAADHPVQRRQGAGAGRPHRLRGRRLRPVPRRPPGLFGEGACLGRLPHRRPAHRSHRQQVQGRQLSHHEPARKGPLRPRLSGQSAHPTSLLIVVCCKCETRMIFREMCQGLERFEVIFCNEIGAWLLFVERYWTT